MARLPTRHLPVLALLAISLSGCGREEEPAASPSPPERTPAGTPAPAQVAVLDLGDGVTAHILADGTGAEAASGNYVRLDLRIHPEDAEDRGWEGVFGFVLGSGQAIPGLDRGVTGMRAGEHRRLHIPHALTHLPDGSAAFSMELPQDLLADITLLAVEDTEETLPQP